MRKYILFFVCIALALLIQQASAQTCDRDVVGSAGTYVTSSYGSMAWTIGEVTIETYASSGNFFTQGFHQPDERLAEVITPFFIPEGFSPNGDDVNDQFVIKGLESYPKNEIVIYNRWGNKVFEAMPYLNNWDGRCKIGLRVGGEQLPVATYFYVLDLHDGSPVYKGTVYLNR